MTITRIAYSRRGLLAALGAGGGSLLLAGCGFKLREAPVFAFKTIAVAPGSAYLNQLRRAINTTGTLVAVPPEQAATADVVFEVLGENRDQAVLSTNSAGQVRELQLYLRIRFRLRTQGGRELIEPTTMEQSRDITYNETAALAKESETNLLYRDMTSDLVQQTLRRLGAVKAM